MSLVLSHHAYFYYFLHFKYREINMYNYGIKPGFLGDIVVKNPPVNVEMWKIQVWSLGWEDPLEWEVATYFRILAWKFHNIFQKSLMGYSPWGL